MKKSVVTLESLDQKIDTKIDLLDKKIDLIDLKFESKIDLLDKKNDSKFDHLDKKISSVEQKVDDVMDFLKEHMYMREEIDQQIDSKFSKYTSDQFEFQDRVGKQCETNTNETLALHHRVTAIEQQIGI